MEEHMPIFWAYAQIPILLALDAFFPLLDEDSKNGRLYFWT